MHALGEALQVDPRLVELVLELLERHGGIAVALPAKHGEAPRQLRESRLDTARQALADPAALLVGDLDKAPPRRGHVLQALRALGLHRGGCHRQPRDGSHGLGQALVGQRRRVVHERGDRAAGVTHEGHGAPCRRPAGATAGRPSSSTHPSLTR